MIALPSNLPPIITPRLILRAMQASDSGDLFEIYGDPEVMRYASDPPFQSQSTVSEMLTSVARLLQEKVSLECGIVVQQTDRLIGTCGLHSFDHPNLTAEVGCLLARHSWGYGYMQEALAAILEYASRQLALRRLIAEIDSPNSRSIRLFQRLGFQYAGNDSIYTLDLHEA